MKRRIGAHLSMAKGLLEAVQTMEGMGGNCLQIFSGSPRVWARKPIDAFPYEEYNQYVVSKDFGPTVIHALYLVNLASENPELVKKSIDVLRYDMQFNARMHGVGVVVHLGSHQGRGFDASVDMLVSNIEKVLKDSPKESTFLIENSAGQHGKLCSDLHEIRILFDRLHSYVESGQMGWCFDTCHAFAAGYDLEVVEESITKENLWNELKVIHLNDSRDPFNSGRDRHDNIGEGKIGKEVMRTFLHNPKFSHLPCILEVPGFDGSGPDKQNVDIVLNMLN